MTMSAPSVPSGPIAPFAPRRRTRRVLGLVFGLLLLLPGLGLLAGGGVLLWAEWFSRSDGFVLSPQERFSSDGYALVSEAVDLETGARLWTGGDWFPLSVSVGEARLEVTGTGSDDVFVGVAPAAEVTAYLDGVERTVIDALGFDAPPTSADQRAGGAPSGPPGDQDFWAARTSGTGTQQLTWNPGDGEWRFVVMNSDGAAGVDVQARIGAEVPGLGGIGWGVAILGLLVTSVAVLLLVVGIRPSDRRFRRSSTDVAVPTPRRPTAAELWGPQPADARTTEREPGN